MLVGNAKIPVYALSLSGALPTVPSGETEDVVAAGEVQLVLPADSGPDHF